MNIRINITTNAFSDSEKESMWQIYSKYYHHSRESFMNRIPTNNYYAVYSLDGQIIGFTGLRINHAMIEGRKRLLMYFGQTVVEKEYRGYGLLQKTGARLCLIYWREVLKGNAYYWCDALTYKPYLVFAKTLKDYYPSRKYTTPASVRSIMGYIGEKHYRESYQAATGTVKKPFNFVNDRTVTIREEDLSDPDIRFFARANPGFSKGHGLLTIAPISIRNVFYIAKNLLRKYILLSVSKSGTEALRTVS